MLFGKKYTVSCWNGEIMTICMAARKKTVIHNKFKPPPWYVVITILVCWFVLQMISRASCIFTLNIIIIIVYCHSFFITIVMILIFMFIITISTNRVISMFNLMLIIIVFVYQLYVRYLSNHKVNLNLPKYVKFLIFGRHYRLGENTWEYRDVHAGNPIWITHKKQMMARKRWPL